MTKPSIPQGTRDFSAETVRKRNYIFSTIRSVFELYGFEPLETPAFENLDTLMGKYGEEGDKLIFRILDSGNSFDKKFYEELFKALQNYLKDEKEHLDSALIKQGIYDAPSLPTDLLNLNPIVLAFMVERLLNNEAYKKHYLPKLKNEVAGKALKYDLTIPFARYVAMNYTKLTVPFRRYQIQPVWRADRPQKGRYREFTQCDADVVGSNSLLNEVELATIYAEVFNQLGIPVKIKINSRKIIQTLADYVRLFGLPIDNDPMISASMKPLSETEEMLNIAIAIDKFDKLGIDGVTEELQTRGLNNNQINIIVKYLTIDGNNNEKIKQLIDLFQNSNAPGSIRKGINEIEFILDNIQNSTYKEQIIIDFTLARGLNYYTGIIFEVTANNIKMGSIGGGGRYDDLTGLFGVPNIPGVGISFGVDRIYDVLEEMNLFPENLQVSTKALFFNMGDTESRFAFGIMQQVRSNGIACELYHEAVKINKQFTYAEKKNIPFVIIIGSKEMEEKSCSVKNLATGVQEVVLLEKLAEYLKNL